MKNVSKRKSPRTVRSLVESLEPRRLCSVTVSQGYPGYYQIDADNNANSIVVSVNQNAGTFTLNGVNYTGVSYITINGYGGNDYIQVAGSPGPIGCAINVGDGNDTISLNFDGVIRAGNGQDNIFLKDSFRGEVHTGSGNDQMYISGRCVDAVVYAGDGNDLIDASTNLYGLTIYGGNGNDTIYGSQGGDQIHTGRGSNLICCTAGNNTVYALNGSPDTIYGGSGNDTVYGDRIDTVYNVHKKNVFLY